MARDPDAGRLRRYVLAKADGRVPRPEWAHFAMLQGDVGAWILADESAAKAHTHWRRIRVRNEPWCPVLGHDIGIAIDAALQTYFRLQGDETWPRLALAARRNPERCLREWRETGRRVRDAVLNGPVENRPLKGWPGTKRRIGARSYRARLIRQFL